VNTGIVGRVVAGWCNVLIGVNTGIVGRDVAGWGHVWCES
jgi:hypothetical protein